MSDSSSRANLARTRDNQRRSRQRRKDYLHELEKKYRECERLGVEASAQIQAAARKVLEENRKLRALLKSRGMSDTEIDEVISPEETRPNSSPTLPSAEMAKLLKNRKQCRAGKELSPTSGQLKTARFLKPASSTSSTSPQRSPIPNAVTPASAPIAATPAPVISRSQQDLGHFSPTYFELPMANLPYTSLSDDLELHGIWPTSDLNFSVPSYSNCSSDAGQSLQVTAGSGIEFGFNYSPSSGHGSHGRDDFSALYGDGHR